MKFVSQNCKLVVSQAILKSFRLSQNRVASGIIHLFVSPCHNCASCSVHATWAL